MAMIRKECNGCWYWAEVSQICNTKYCPYQNKTSTHLDLDKTALVFAGTLHGQNWANLSEGAQQTSLKAFKSILLKECKADD